MMHKEALLNVHLNNSRLLHSRLAWNPNMWSSLTQGMEKSAMSAGVKYVQKWAMINNDIADEVSFKLTFKIFVPRDKMHHYLHTLACFWKYVNLKSKCLAKQIKVN